MSCSVYDLTLAHFQNPKPYFKIIYAIFDLLYEIFRFDITFRLSSNMRFHSIVFLFPGYGPLMSTLANHMFAGSCFIPVRRFGSLFFFWTTLGDPRRPIAWDSR